MPIGTARFEGFTQFGEFFAATHSGLWWQVRVDRLIRQARAIAPGLIQQVDIGTQPGTTFFKLAAQGARRGHGHHRTIHRDHATFRGLLGQPLQRARLPRLQLDQFDAAALEFLGRLLPVTTVCPDAGECLSDDQRTDRAMKARQPLTPLPVTRQVLRQVRIGRRHQQGVNALPAHQLAGERQALGNRSLGQRLRTHHVSC
ncbi:hypothetical protein D3C85_774300 [compost metagenome]